MTSPPAQRPPVVEADVSPDPIDPSSLVERVGHPDDGAVLLFLGTVRTWNREREVTALEYEAYGAMAREELAEIAREAAERHGASRVAAVHRTGALRPGQASVGIAVAAVHRDAAYRTSREVIEEVKRRLPVWKKESYADGGSAWLDGHPVAGRAGEPTGPTAGAAGPAGEDEA